MKIPVGELITVQKKITIKAEVGKEFAHIGLRGIRVSVNERKVNNFIAELQNLILKYEWLYKLKRKINESKGLAPREQNHNRTSRE